MQKITPFLWFNDQAEDAVKFYTSTFKNSKTMKIARVGESAAEVTGRPKGSVMTLQFQLEGQEFVALNGGPHFRFTPAISFFVGCDSIEEIDRLWGKLSDGGSVLMALNKYPWAEKYGWCEDKYGLSWQLMLSSRKQKITPTLCFVKEQHGRAAEAMNFYTSIFRDSVIESVARDEQMRVVLHGRFTLAGQNFIVTEPPSPEGHDFTFSLANSFVVNCESQGEIDSMWAKLTDGGAESECGWLTDKFGVAWQVVPADLGDMMSDPDPKKSDRVMREVFKMKKLDLAMMKRAFEER